MKLIKYIKRTLFLLMILIANGSVAQIIQAEYFLDSDPGQGNGISMVAADGNLDNAIESVLKNGISIATPGRHVIGVRVKNDSLHWGPVFKTVVSVENTLTTRAIMISQAEFFWDTDPGAGNGTILLAFDGNFNDAFESIYKSGITLPLQGIHKLCIRVKDADSNWGPVYSSIVSVENVMWGRNTKISTGEFFWDNDPGQGNGTAILAFDGNFNNAFEELSKSNISLPSAGIHKFNIRVRDASLTWGPVYTNMISIENMATSRPINITLGEMFWDNDPGQGNGIALLAFDGSYSDAVEQLLKTGISLPSVGLHKLKVRVKDATNTWGPVFTFIVNIDNPFVPRNIKVVEAETFWDTDPGQGNGIPIMAIDGSFDNAFEALSKGLLTSDLNEGHHKLNVRIKGFDGTWGPLFTSIVYIDPCSTHPIPTLTANGSTTICQGDSLQLVAQTGFTTYSWLKGSTELGLTNQSIYVKDPGFYKVIVKDNNGCPGVSDTTIVTVIPLNPIITPSGNTVFCNGNSVSLNAGGPYDTYLWSNISTSSAINVTTSGNYTVTVSLSGCTRVAPSINVVVHPLPSVPDINASGPLTFCTGDSVVLTSTAATHYLWSTGDTAQSITVHFSGNYSVNAINSFGCSTSSLPVTVAVTSSTPVITSIGPNNVCDGDAVTLNAGGGYTQYNWSNGETTQMISVTTSGTYTVTCTNVTCVGVSNPFSVFVYPNPVAPTISTSGATTFCQGGNVILTSSSPVNNVWSNGDTNQSITVTNAGNYSVSLHNGFGCSAVSANQAVNVISTDAAISVTGSTTICDGDTTILSAIPGYTSYLWSTGDTTPFIKVSTNGSYFVTITNQICTSVSQGVNIISSPLPTVPAITFVGSTEFCSGESVQLVSSIANSYLWSTGETSQSITVTNSGTYFVNAYNAYGCGNTSIPVVTTVYPNPQPVILYSGPTSFCAGDSIVLSSSVSHGNLWSNGDTAQIITVFNSGNYTVSVDNGNGCFATSTPVSVSVTPLNPSITATSPTAFCQGGNVVLDAGTGYNSYLWSNGQTTQTVDVSQGGNYTVTVTQNGCTRPSPSLTVTVYPLPSIPIITALDTTQFCDGGSVELMSSTADQYLWSNGATTQNMTATASNCYSVMITDINGCTRTSSCENVTVIPSPTIPLISVSGPVTFCQGDSVILTSSINDFYLWSNGEITRDVAITNSGNYNVTVTNTSGCTSSSNNVLVTVNPAQNVPFISYVGNTTFCQGDSIILTSSTSDSYLWSNGDTLQSTVVYTAGAYYVETTNLSGCSQTSEMINITVHPAQSTPVITPNGSLTFCQGDSVILTSTPANSYLWSDGEQTRDVTILNSGTYNVTVSNASGCTSASTDLIVTVLPAQEVPVISYAGNTTFCQGDSVILTSSASDSYLWSNGDTLQSIVVYTTGNYSVETTNLPGCSQTSETVNVTVHPAQSTPVVTPSGPLTFCEGDSVIFTTAIADAYLWSTSDTTQSIVANTTGNYNVTVYNQYSCSASSTDLNVTVLPNPPQPTMTLLAGDTLHTVPAEAYQWYYNGVPILNADTISIKAYTSGSYMVVITDVNGCTSASEVYVFVSVEEKFAETYSVKVYPNPYVDYATFEVTMPENNKEISFVMYDLTGNVVKSIDKITTNSFKIDRENLARGMYMFKLLNQKKETFGSGRLMVE